MSTSFWQVILFLLAGIVVIILLTTLFRVHAFFALLIASFVVGLGVQMPVTDILNTTKQGFGNIMQSLGFIIVLGTTLGVLLEHTGSTRKMAQFILKKTGERNAATAMSITGFIVGLPLFCDSGFIVLSGLNKSLARRTGTPLSIMSVSLATGLYAVHCLIPPHPGAAGAAGVIGVDIGRLMITGIAVAIPGMIVGRWWASKAGKKFITQAPEERIDASDEKGPSTLNAFLPVIVPIILIALKSVFSFDPKSSSAFQKILSIAGDPIIALSAGVLLAFTVNRLWRSAKFSGLFMEAAEKAGGILVIIGAGGAFGAILGATKIGDHISAVVNLHSLGIFFPFLLTFILKTAQGSSTVAIITASSIVFPMLHILSLDSDNGKLLTVLAMGAGSMMISHANDAYFWVISKFSGLDMKTMIRVYTLASIYMGLISLLVVYVMSLIML
jgi:GntP family gluconate:H+ symporter